jgi:dihydrofolate reductase
MKVPNILIPFEADNHPAMLLGSRMSKIRYIVAMSLDGYVAGPKGVADWILMDPDVNFAELWAQFDTLIMGRKTYDAASARLGEAFMQGMKTVVVSRTLRSVDAPAVSILSELNRDWLQSLRAQSRKDVWLMGGGELFGSMLAMHAVDTVEVSIMPVLLGGGVPVLLPPTERTMLKLSSHKVYRSGIVSLVYDVQNPL